MSHVVSLSIADVQNLREIRLRLTETVDSDADEAEMTPWITTVDSIITQAEEDGA